MYLIVIIVWKSLAWVSYTEFDIGQLSFCKNLTRIYNFFKSESRIWDSHKPPRYFSKRFSEKSQSIKAVKQTYKDVFKEAWRENWIKSPHKVKIAKVAQDFLTNNVWHYMLSYLAVIYSSGEDSITVRSWI